MSANNKTYYLTRAQSILLPKTNTLKKFTAELVTLTHNEWQKEFVQPMTCAFEFRFKLNCGDILLYKDYSQPQIQYMQMILISK
jgi:hypothetical protein